ncbi:MAG: lysine decarboxylase [Deltaproteobacteria bacterium]|nr:lysine decarboxylase [Deltaproteobacteria bacterium]
MDVIDLKKYPVLILDDTLDAPSHVGKTTQEALAYLEKEGMAVERCYTQKEILDILAHNSISSSGIVADWDTLDAAKIVIGEFIREIRNLNQEIPVFLLTNRHEVEDEVLDELEEINGVLWKYGDTIDFACGRIYEECRDYIYGLIPPFFMELVKYTEKYKYAWHTPGHMGGIAFIKSPVGRIFYDFFGETVFRSDLSVSVPELGSLMDHSAVNGTAEQITAKVFGADESFYVTNGTSTANKMAFMSAVTVGDVCLIDRNCHKSLQHSITLAGAIPIYFRPTRNPYGIIGGIPEAEFSPEAIREKIEQSPLIKDKDVIPGIAVVTNSTYDGLLYNTKKVKDVLGQTDIPILHFDEAWYAYAHFHPFYEGKYAMDKHEAESHPTVFATQSTHKLLAAFSQASMVHVKHGKRTFNRDLFNETFMMHTSTSPQYNMIASLDVATKMMEGMRGTHMVNEAIIQAIEFRKETKKIRRNYVKESMAPTRENWFFDVWQPPTIENIETKTNKGINIRIDETYANEWELAPEKSWHGFKDIDENHMTLDPIKVTVLTPGVTIDGEMTDFGIPAPIVSAFLVQNGVVDEKTGLYNLLFLFSIGVNKSKTSMLLGKLIQFKERFSDNCLVADILPDLVCQSPERYDSVRIQDLAAEMHSFLKAHHASDLQAEAYNALPEQVMTPAAAYHHIVKAHTEEVFLNNIQGRVILTMLAPYPPGIPVVMPGERFTGEHAPIISFLQLLEAFDNQFPGFENDVHGAEVRHVDGKRRYAVNCLKDAE